MKLFKFFAIIAIACTALSAHGGTLATFDLNHFDGWIYTRPNTKLSTTYIGAKGVSIFKASTGIDYTLISPPFSAASVRYVRVEMKYGSPTCSEPAYSLTKNSPTIELLDLNGNVVKQHFHQLHDVALRHTIVAFLEVPAGVADVKVRLAAWLADKDTPGYVSAVSITDSKLPYDAIEGDVNADGKLNVTDVTDLINTILGQENIDVAVADLDANGVVDVSDVTKLINLLLAK